MAVNALAGLAREAASSPFMRGLTALPYRLAGGPVDLADMVVRPIANAAGIPIAEPENMYGTSDWMIKRAIDAGLLMPRTDTRSEMAGDFLGQIASPGVGPAEAGTMKAIFAGPLALTADHDALARATARLDAGDDPARVWAEEGWFRGPDGKMRFEIDDSQAALTGEGSGDFVRRRMAEGVPARNAIDELRQLEAKNGPMMQNYAMPGQSTLPAVMSHPALFEAYPDTMTTRYATRQEIPMGEGMYSPEADAVFLGPTEPVAARSNMLHELQHGVQAREGFAAGGSPSDMAVELSRARQNVTRARDLQMLVEEAANYGGSLDDAARAIREAGIDIDDDLVAEAIRLGERGVSQRLKSANDALAALGPAATRRTYNDPANELYRRLAGEAEARAVQARRDFTPEQRRARYPLQDYDVPLDELIIRR